MIRLNSSAMFVWSQTEDEANQICMDLSTKYGFKRTFQIYRACTEEKHSFLLYDALENKFSSGSSLKWLSKIISKGLRPHAAGPLFFCGMVATRRSGYVRAGH